MTAGHSPEERLVLHEARTCLHQLHGFADLLGESAADNGNRGLASHVSSLRKHIAALIPAFTEASNKPRAAESAVPLWATSALRNDVKQLTVIARQIPSGLTLEDKQDLRRIRDAAKRLLLLVETLGDPPHVPQIAPE